MIVSGGLKSAEAARRAYEESGADAVMIARGSLGNPWVFEELTGRRTAPPRREEVAAELLWVIDRAEEHLGSRARRPLPAQVLPLVHGAAWTPRPSSPTSFSAAPTCRAGARRLIADLADCRVALAIIPRLPALVWRGRAAAPGRFWVWEPFPAVLNPQSEVGPK